MDKTKSTEATDWASVLGIGDDASSQLARLARGESSAVAEVVARARQLLASGEPLEPDLFELSQPGAPHPAPEASEWTQEQHTIAEPLAALAQEKQRGHSELADEPDIPALVTPTDEPPLEGLAEGTREALFGGGEFEPQQTTVADPLAADAQEKIREHQEDAGPAQDPLKQETLDWPPNGGEEVLPGPDMSTGSYEPEPDEFGPSTYVVEDGQPGQPNVHEQTTKYSETDQAAIAATASDTGEFGSDYNDVTIVPRNYEPEALFDGSPTAVHCPSEQVLEALGDRSVTAKTQLDDEHGGFDHTDPPTPSESLDLSDVKVREPSVPGMPLADAAPPPVPGLDNALAALESAPERADSTLSLEEEDIELLDDDDLLMIDDSMEFESGAKTTSAPPPPEFQADLASDDEDGGEDNADGTRPKRQSIFKRLFKKE